MNPRDASHQIRDKAWATATLDAAGLGTGEVLALVNLSDEAGVSEDRFEVLKTEESVRGLLAACPADGLVIKPMRGGGGANVMVFREVDAHELLRFDRSIMPVEELFQVLRTAAPIWKVERRMLQHPVLAAIAGETLSTIRMLVYRMRDGSIHLGPAAWKVAVSDSGLDHFMHGEGQYAGEVDPLTGEIGPIRRWVSLDHLENHPVTNARISGVVMPFWTEACTLARAAAACFPSVWAPAFDIAITPTGPVVIEANVYWNEELTQAPGPTGLVQGHFRQFLEERGCGTVVNFAARDRVGDG